MTSRSLMWCPSQFGKGEFRGLKPKTLRLAFIFLLASAMLSGCATCHLSFVKRAFIVVPYANILSGFSCAHAFPEMACFCRLTIGEHVAQYFCVGPMGRYS